MKQPIVAEMSLQELLVLREELWRKPLRRKDLETLGRVDKRIQELRRMK